MGNHKPETELPRALELYARVLRALTPGARAILEENFDKIELGLGRTTGAHFPVPKREKVELGLRPKVTIAFTFNEEEAEKKPDVFLSAVAHHIGHVLCYLRNPRWIHRCPDASAEFDRSLLPNHNRLKRQLALGSAKQAAEEKRELERINRLPPREKREWLALRRWMDKHFG